jgi:hypothetical protein
MAGKTETKPRMTVASNSKLPICSVIDDPDTFRQCVALLQRATDATVKESEAREEKQEVSEQLAAICEAYQLPGVRHGLNKFEYYGWQTRKTLSSKKLLALGVSAEIIEQAYEDSKPFLSTRINPFDIE